MYIYIYMYSYVKLSDQPRFPKLRFIAPPGKKNLVKLGSVGEASPNPAR